MEPILSKLAFLPKPGAYAIRQDHQIRVLSSTLHLSPAMFYSFARVSAVLKLKVDDYYQNGARRRLRLHEKGGKEHEMPVHHLLEQILNEYVEAAGLRSGQPLLQSVDSTGMQVT